MSCQVPFYYHRDLMKGLTQLESLTLEHNWLQHIAVQAFQHVPGLKQLTLSHNHLSLRGTHTDTGEVQSVLNACLKLEELYVRNNSITTIFSDWVWTLVNLQILDLSHNLISSLVVSMQDFMFHNRGKALGNAAYKILVNIILGKIKPYVENITSDYQNGFRNGRLVIDNISDTKYKNGS